MHKRDVIVLFFKWLGYRAWVLLGALGGCMLFVVLSFLAHIDPSPSLYAAGVCLFILLFWSVYDFVRVVRKSTQLVHLRQNLGITLEALPEQANFIEAQYQEIVRSLYHELMLKTAQEGKIKSEREDYYTLWVHQIKTPISALRLLLKSDNLPKNAFAMEQELFKVEQYAEMVLQYLRLESLSCDFVLKEYSLHTLIKQSVKKYAYAFISKGLSVNLEEFDFCTVTDEKWLCFVLEQLLSNSVKYTFKGGVKICMDPEQDRTLLISDSGIGIKSEDLPRVFERGFTGYNGRMDKVSTGIGLYLCKRVADRLGLELRIASTPNKGTQYRIHFPPAPTTLQN